MTKKSDDNNLKGVDRRDFLSLGAGAAGLFCALSAKDISNLSSRDVKHIDAAAASLKHPKFKAKAAAATLDPVDRYDFDTADPAPGGQVREYWIQATTVLWDPIPTGKDAWMGGKQTHKKFRALVYQLMTPGFASTAGVAQMPGPTLEANVGDVLRVHFRNADTTLNQPVTMHPHGVRYTPDYDGIYLGDFTRAGGFIAPGEEFTYTWECLPESEGVWPYHDHGPNHVLNSARGLFGSIIIRDPGKPRPDREVCLHLHSLAPPITGTPSMLHAINGRAFAGNTPTIRTKVGQTVAIHVLGMNSDFHTWHLHGHRWPDAAGTFVDSPAVGPSEVISIRYTEDNPGRFLYHCHVSSHMDAGMAGWYLVEK